MNKPLCTPIQLTTELSLKKVVDNLIKIPLFNVADTRLTDYAMALLKYHSVNLTDNKIMVVMNPTLSDDSNESNCCGVVESIQLDIGTGSYMGEVRLQGPKADMLKKLIKTETKVGISIRGVRPVGKYGEVLTHQIDRVTAFKLGALE